MRDYSAIRNTILDFIQTNEIPTVFCKESNAKNWDMEFGEKSVIFAMPYGRLLATFKSDLSVVRFCFSENFYIVPVLKILKIGFRQTDSSYSSYETDYMELKTFMQLLLAIG
jgi:hypothetical protein